MEKKVKRIVIVYDYAYLNGGAAKVAIQSAIGLKKMGLDVFYFAAVGPVCQELKDAGIEVKCLETNDINTGKRVTAVINGVWNLQASYEFQKFIDKFDRRSTIVHIHGWSKALSSSIVHKSGELGFKTIITLHDYFILCPNGGFYNYQKREICTYSGMGLKCFFCNCDKRSYAQKMWRNIRQIVQDSVVKKNDKLAYISISQKNEQLVCNRVKSNKFFRVLNPIQLSEKKIKDISNNKIYLYIGRVSEEKGVELFCEAFNELKQQNNNITGMVIGDGPSLKKLSQKYAGKLEFIGWKEPQEVQRYLLKARTLVFPSKWYEGAPLTIVEAMSAGVPCIVADCTSAGEVVENNVNGLLFQANNRMDLLNKMQVMMEKEAVTKFNENLVNKMDFSKYKMDFHTAELVKVYNSWLNE